MKLVFATHNQNKFLEVKALMPEYIELLSLKEIGCEEDIAETADTIEGNALLKANYVFDNYRVACFADDTGLEVKALDNAPGVFSARYAGLENNAQANMEKLLQNLRGRENRDARFKTAIALRTFSAKEVFLGLCEGEIIESPKGEAGFGYDPIFRPLGYEKTFAQMDLDEKSAIGHRGKAIRQLVKYLSEIK